MQARGPSTCGHESLHFDLSPIHLSPPQSLLAVALLVASQGQETGQPIRVLQEDWSQRFKLTPRLNQVIDAFRIARVLFPFKKIPTELNWMTDDLDFLFP